MFKVSNELMHAILMFMVNKDEDYSNGIYCGFGKAVKFSTSALNNLYGFIATTDKNVLLIAQFNVMGQVYARMRLPLESMKKLKIGKVPLTNMCSIKMSFNFEGKDYDFNIKANKNVHMTNLKDQETNLENILIELKKWCVET